MLSPLEQERVKLKAIEQAMKEAGLAGMEPEPLMPTPAGPWPFVLTQDDWVFLRVQKIDPA